MRKLFYVLLAASVVSCSNESEKPKQVAQYTIEQFYKSTEAFGGSFNSDDSKLLFTSNESGIFNLWEADIATGKSAAKTNSTKESFFSIGYVPGTSHFLYSADKGGDENSHIYLKTNDSAVKGEIFTQFSNC